MNIDRRPLIRGIDCGTSVAPRRADPELINSICVDSSYRNYLSDRQPLSMIRPLVSSLRGDASFYKLFLCSAKRVYNCGQRFIQLISTPSPLSLLIYRFNLIPIYFYVSVKLSRTDVSVDSAFLTRLVNISISILFYDRVQVIQFREEARRLCS